MKVLFLCRGNVGRSVFAEYLYNKLTNTNNACSAGTQISGPEESLDDLLPKSQFVIDSMNKEGVDVKKHIRRKVTREMVNSADFIIDMAEPETVQGFVKNHPNHIVWSVDDPKGTSLEKHVEIMNEVKDNVKDFVQSSRF